MSAARGRAPGAIALGLSLAATVAVWRTVLFSRRLIESGDLLMPLDMGSLRHLFLPFWNPTFEFPNVETAGRLPWMLPFLALPSPALAEHLMIAAAVLAAAVAMYAAARRLGAARALAALASALYASNPWTAIRLQHYFLLPGYAVLPLLLALWVRPLRRGTPLVLAALSTLSAASPHQLVFAWGLALLWLAFDPTRAAVGRFLVAAGLFLLLDAFWIVPTVLVLTGSPVTPGAPTLELERAFSASAGLAAVARLQGYWWPLASVSTPALVDIAGLGLVAAAALSLRRLGRLRIFLLAGVAIFGLLALGTHVPVLVRWLVVEGPVAARIGWLLRDPNKAVGPLACLLLLLAAIGPAPPRLPGSSRRPASPPGPRAAVQTTPATPGRARANAARAALLALYAIFAAVWVPAYLGAAYAPHDPPAGFTTANAYLAGRGGRALWIPPYRGSTALWNGTHLTPEVSAYSSTVPLLDGYGYDLRASTSYTALYDGVLLGGLRVDLGRVLRGWGARWLVHQRDLPPSWAGGNPGIERLVPALARQGLEPTAAFPPVYVYDVGSPVTSAEPGSVLASEQPLAAYLAWSNLEGSDGGRAFVARAHEGVAGIAVLPGDEPALLLAGGTSIDLAAATAHYAPERRWSRVADTDPAVFAKTLAAGLSLTPSRTLVLTSASGAELRTRARARAGAYRVLARVYEGPSGGALELSVGSLLRTLNTDAVDVRSRWHDLGEVDLGAGAAEVRLRNLAGLNAVADLRLVPVAAWRAALTAAAHEPMVWLWPSTAICSGGAPSPGTAPVTVLPGEAPLPLDRAVVGGAAWRRYTAVTFDLLGNGDGAPVEVWTRAGGTWVLLGTAHAWWRGWRRVRVPVTASNFGAAPGGAASRATALRLLAPSTGAGAAALRVRGVSLDARASCALHLRAPAAGPATLLAAGVPAGAEASLDGEAVTLGDAPTAVSLRAGDNTLELPAEVVSSLRAIAVAIPARDRPATAAPSTGGSPAPSCEAAGWRLWIPGPPYVQGWRASAGATRLEPAAADYLRQAFWLPPGTCGPITVRQAAESAARAGRVVTLAAVAVLAAIGLLAVRRARRPARGG